MSPTKTHRPLTSPEALLWWFDRGAPVHFVTIAEVRGPLNESRLRRGIDAARARHPLLRVCVRAEAGVPHFAPFDGPVPLSIEDTPADALHQRVAAELLVPMPATEGSLWRCVWLRHPAGGDDGETRDDAHGHLLIALHHSISDGRSGTHLIHDVLQGAGGAELPPLEPVPPLWDARPVSTRGLRAWAHLLASLTRDLWRVLRRGRPKGTRIERKVPLGERRPHLFPLVLSAAATTALISRAREERTTVHGILTAVLMQTLATEHDGPVGMSCGSPVDLRPHLTPAIGSEMGYYVGLSQSLHRVDARTDPWPLARAIRADLILDVARGRPTMFHQLADLVFRLLMRTRPEPGALAERIYRLPIRPTTGITNLGRLALSETCGDLRITALYFSVTPSALADFASTATTFAGQLRWTFTAMEPALSPGRAQALVAEIERRLHQVITERRE